MFRRPITNKESEFEYSPDYLTREKRMLFLRGVIAAYPGGYPGRNDQFSPTSIMDDIMAFNIEDPSKPITLFIDSIGGEFSTGMALYDIIKLSKAPIITVGINCASMGSIIFMAGNKRLVFPSSRFMLHLPSAVIQSEVSLDVKELEIKSKELNRVKEEVVDYYIDNGVTAGLGKSADKLKIRKQIFKDIDRAFWLTAKEAINYGLADSIITKEELLGGASV